MEVIWKGIISSHLVEDRGEYIRIFNDGMSRATMYIRGIKLSKLYIVSKRKGKKILLIGPGRGFIRHETEERVFYRFYNYTPDFFQKMINIYDKILSLIDERRPKYILSESKDELSFTICGAHLLIRMIWAKNQIQWVFLFLELKISMVIVFDSSYKLVNILHHNDGKFFGPFHEFHDNGTVKSVRWFDHEGRGLISHEVYDVDGGMINNRGSKSSFILPPELDIKIDSLNGKIIKYQFLLGYTSETERRDSITVDFHANGSVKSVNCIKGDNYILPYVKFDSGGKIEEEGYNRENDPIWSFAKYKDGELTEQGYYFAGQKVNSWFDKDRGKIEYMKDLESRMIPLPLTGFNTIERLSSRDC